MFIHVSYFGAAAEWCIKYRLLKVKVCERTGWWLKYNAWIHVSLGGRTNCLRYYDSYSVHPMQGSRPAGNNVKLQSYISFKLNFYKPSFVAWTELWSVTNNKGNTEYSKIKLAFNWESCITSGESFCSLVSLPRTVFHWKFLTMMMQRRRNMVRC